MNGLCRDYGIISSEGDSTCIVHELVCSFHKKKASMIVKSKDELDQFSFLLIANDFNDIVLVDVTEGYMVSLLHR